MCRWVGDSNYTNASFENAISVYWMVDMTVFFSPSSLGKTPSGIDGTNGESISKEFNKTYIDCLTL